MIYARVLDQTMADDYFKAMEQIEQQLTLPATILNQPPSTGEMLDLVDQLFGSALNPAQFEIVSALRTGLEKLVANDALFRKYDEKPKVLLMWPD
jgi:hypothetical protein